MFVIDFKSASGGVLPFQLSIEPHDRYRAHLRVAEGDKSLADALVPYDVIPLSANEPDVQVGMIGLGFEPLLGQLLVEFGDDPRLGLISAGEVRSAILVCRCYDSAMKS